MHKCMLKIFLSQDVLVHEVDEPSSSTELDYSSIIYYTAITGSSVSLVGLVLTLLTLLIFK